jgi:hypothetical protein
MMPHRANLLAVAAVFAMVSPSAASAAFNVSYAYSLSSTTGIMRGTMGPRLSYDAQSKELYVSAEGMVKVFSPSGMEVFSFDDVCAQAPAIAGFKNGEFLAIAQGGLVRCNYRGEFAAKVEIAGLPAGTVVAGDVLAYVSGHVYIANTNAKKVLVLDDELKFVRSYDLGEIVGLAADDAENDIRGFTVDQSGNMLFTVPTQFLAYVVSPDGKFQTFGKKGSSPGKFNVVGPIARDESGYVYVADMLRSVVMVFDPSFKFVREFGYRGNKPWNLATPADMVVGDGKLFVSSMNARKAVVVFKVSGS